LHQPLINQNDHISVHWHMQSVYISIYVEKALNRKLLYDSHFISVRRTESANCLLVLFDDDINIVIFVNLSDINTKFLV